MKILNREQKQDLRKTYKVDHGRVINTNTNNSMSLSKGKYQLTALGERAKYNAQYIKSVLTHKEDAGYDIVLSSEIIHNRYKLVDDVIISKKANKPLTMTTPTTIRVSVNQKKICVSYHNAIDILSSPAKVDAPVKKKVAPVKEKKLVKTFKNSAQKPLIKSTYALGPTTKSYNGPIGDIDKFNELFNKAKAKACRLNLGNGLSSYPDEHVLKEIKKTLSSDIDKLLLAWAQLHKFKAKHGQLNSY